MLKNALIVITGPTGVGKSEISLKIAKLLNGEIINCDASQFKKGLNIGTAKIDLTQTAIPHHLIDIIDAESNYSIYDFQKKARDIISNLFKKGKTPILVGGSGLYINSVIYDYDLEASKSKKEDYSNLNNEELYALLLKYDKGAKIDKENRRRVIRAIELALDGKKISENKCSSDYVYNTIGFVINAPREILYDRINARVDKMISDGLIDEIKMLKDNGVNLNNLNEIGYKELVPYLEGKCSIDDAISLIKQNTRHFAKRQLTWFRNKMEFPFIDIDYNDINNTVEEIIKYINK